MTLEVETKRGIGIPSSFPMPWITYAEAWYKGECEVFSINGYGWTASFEDGGCTISFDLQGAILSGIAGLAQTFGGLPIHSPISETGIDCYHWEIAHASGGPSVYSVQFGDAGGPFIQTAEGTIRFCDELVIQSTEETVIELPYSLGADLLASESFGNPEETRGIARARVNGSVGGIPVLMDQGEVESVSVIPTTLTFSSSGAVSIPVGIGETRVPVELEANVFVEAKARCAGFWCMITAASTAAVLMPGSFVIGQLQGEGGAPIPDCISAIYSDFTNVVYHGAALAAPDVTLIHDENDLLLTWDSVPEAIAYNVYQVGADGSLDLLGETSDLAFDLAPYLEPAPNPSQTMLLQVKATK